MSDRPPILVTGAHRSGTTWVGRMLAAARDTVYISEPLNHLHRPGVFRAPVPFWYPYITAANEAAYLGAFSDLIALRYHLRAELRALRSRRDLLRMGRDFAVFAGGRLRRQRVLMKDPFAVFSAPWLAHRLGCRVVITVRHPAGFASSLMRLGWPFDFRNLLDQPDLMRDHLEADRVAMEAAEPGDILGQAALLWRMIYRVVHGYRLRAAGFLIVRQEDLALDPPAGYESLYRSLGLPFDEGVRRTILTSSSSENPAEPSRRNVYSVKLDSRAAADNWRKRLSAEEIGRVRRLTEPVSQEFYSEREW